MWYVASTPLVKPLQVRTLTGPNPWCDLVFHNDPRGGHPINDRLPLLQCRGWAARVACEPACGLKSARFPPHVDQVGADYDTGTQRLGSR